GPARPEAAPAAAVLSGGNRVRRERVCSNRRKWPRVQLLNGDSARENKFGGPDRARTGDLMNAIHARSQLRHRPTRSVLQQRSIRRVGPTVKTGPETRRFRPPPAPTLRGTS